MWYIICTIYLIVMMIALASVNWFWKIRKINIDEKEGLTFASVLCPIAIPIGIFATICILIYNVIYNGVDRILTKIVLSSNGNKRKTSQNN